MDSAPDRYSRRSFLKQGALAGAAASLAAQASGEQPPAPSAAGKNGIDLFDVTVYDLLPWKSSTYQRDADVSAGDVISDIVSVRWTGDVSAFSSQIVTLTVVVDPYYQGVLTNTAVISHPDLLSEVEVR